MPPPPIRGTQKYIRSCDLGSESKIGVAPLEMGAPKPNPGYARLLFQIVLHSVHLPQSALDALEEDGIEVRRVPPIPGWWVKFC